MFHEDFEEIRERLGTEVKECELVGSLEGTGTAEAGEGSLEGSESADQKPVPGRPGCRRQNSTGRSTGKNHQLSNSSKCFCFISCRILFKQNLIWKSSMKNT